MNVKLTANTGILDLFVVSLTETWS